MKTAIEILFFIREKPRASPLLIAKELNKKPGAIRNYLVVLSELKLVRTPVRGTYFLTEIGELLLWLIALAETPQGINTP